MAFVEPVILKARGIALVPLTLEHEAGLRAAAADGELWNIRVTSVPEPQETRSYIEAALQMREAGNRFAFAVTDEASGTVLGSTSFHDILPAVKRVEIGYTWYAKRCQRTHVEHHLQAADAHARVRHARLPRGRAGAPTTSTTPPSARSSGWARARTA